MKRLFTLALLTIILASFVLPTMAQEATQEATQEAPAPDVTVVVEAPAENPAQESNRFVMVIALVSLLINAVQVFLSHKSIPAELAKQIFAGARVVTSITPDPRDDEVINVLEKAYDGIAGTTTITTTTTEAVG